MGNMETRQEATGRDPEERKDSRTTTAVAASRISDSTLAGDNRHTVNEPTNPEISSEGQHSAGYPFKEEKGYDNQPRKAGYSGKGYTNVT